ncbi:MAG: response regulator, partial [Thermoguttaceae bacterium]
DATCVAVAVPSAGKPFALEGRRVLVVSENHILRSTLVQQLHAWKMVVNNVSSADEAITVLRNAESRKSFDIVFIDAKLNDTNANRTFVKTISTDPVLQHIGVAIMVPFASEINQDEYNEGKVAYLAKPIYYSSLFDTLMTLLYREKLDEVTTHSNFNASDSSTFRITNEQKRKERKKQQIEQAKQFKILVAEDNRINQIVVKNLLNEAGFECDLVINGREACDAAMSEKYDLILMDCQMPETDGYEATMLIRNWEREQGTKRIPIIALTANATKDDSEKCFKVGMDAYCSKPIDAQKVINEIRKWLQAHD